MVAASAAQLHALAAAASSEATPEGLNQSRSLVPSSEDAASAGASAVTTSPLTTSAGDPARSPLVGGRPACWRAILSQCHAYYSSKYGRGGDIDRSIDLPLLLSIHEFLCGFATLIAVPISLSSSFFPSAFILTGPRLGPLLGHDPEAPAHPRQPALCGDAAGPRHRAGVSEWTQPQVSPAQGPEQRSYPRQLLPCAALLVPYAVAVAKPD